jgi:hypothetical protein
LEQVVLAELSKDPSLWKLYGPGALAQDVYLFNGAQLPVIGPAIRATGYDPKNPTPEGIAAAKKQCKTERNISKTVTLASSYGAGAAKIASTLRTQGIDILDAEAEQIHAAYWELYAGVKKYQRFLLNEYRDRRGWVLNGIGRPIGIAQDYTKDIVNRCLVGSTLVRVKDSGWKRLDMCSGHDSIWDGTEWVTCRGLVNQGTKKVITRNGVGLTDDHKIWTKYGGWREAGKCGMHDILPATCPRASWGDIWGLCNHLRYEVAKKWKNVCRRFLSSWQR